MEEKANKPSKRKDKNSSNHLSSMKPVSREEEIKKIGIIQHLTRVGERLQDLSASDKVLEEDKDGLYNQYIKLLNKDIKMINEQKKGYEEELPPNVAVITKSIDENMIKVMNQCISVINNYLYFIEEQKNDLIDEAFELLKNTSYLLDETEDMLKVAIQSVDKTGSIISEA